MGIPIHARRSGFCAELSPQSRHIFFNLKEKKFMHTEDNIYYSVFIKLDGYDDTQEQIAPLLERLTMMKEEAQRIKQPIPYLYGLQVMPSGVYGYPLRLNNPDLYDICFSTGNLPNKSTNRIHTQLRAEGLWTRENRETLTESYNKTVEILSDYGLSVSKVQENRIDYCYHTNIKTSVDKIFERDGDARFIETSLTGGRGEYEKIKTPEGTKLNFFYYSWGSPGSNSWLVKFYDKVKEVIEVGYKSFFFKLWHEGGLISHYDKYCYEYAYLHQNVDYIAKARLKFYIENGADTERIRLYQEALANPNKTLKEYKKMADEFMPSTTPVMNVEYQTMRDFYRRSDKFIKTLKTLEREGPPILNRMYQVLDNREIWLDYLHGDGFSFQKGKTDDGKPIYLPWWERLRNTKVGGIKADEKLLRDYANNMDREVVARQGAKRISSFALMNGLTQTGELEDFLYYAAFLTDNQLHKIDNLTLNKSDGTVIDKLKNPMLASYRNDKRRQEKSIKNRIKQQKVATHEEI